jgi:GH15 family glucan-1,4-alpha-glucosidase
LKDSLKYTLQVPAATVKTFSNIAHDRSIHFNLDKLAKENEKYKNATDRPESMKTPGCRACYAGEHHHGNSVYEEHQDRDREQYTYSKLMCWVALDRGIRLAQKRSLPADLARWLYVRNAIYEYILDKCWNEDRQAFVQSVGSDKLDASILLMPSFFFITPTDPRFVSTLESVFQSASTGGLVSNNLVYRYSSAQKVDAATYSVCTFWAVEAAARLVSNENT